MPKPKVQKGGKEHGTKKNKQGGENDERSRGRAKLVASQPQQPAHLLQARESHAETASKSNSTALGKDSHLRADVCQDLVSSGL